MKPSGGDLATLENKMNNVLIATPMYGGMCAGEYCRAMTHVPITLMRAGHDVSFVFTMNNSVIQMARNQLAGIFYRHEFTHLMFIDADIKFQAEDIVRMLDADKEIIAGVYPKKRINWDMVKQQVDAGVPAERLSRMTGDLVVNLVGGARQQEVDTREPVEVTAAGTGFMLIKRSVFDTLKDRVQTYLDVDDDMVIHEFFSIVKDRNSERLLSEDYAFCQLARDHGIKIHVAPWARLGHYGSYLFEGTLIPVQS